MKGVFGLRAAAAAGLLAVWSTAASAVPGEAHLRQYRDGVPGDRTIQAAAGLGIKVPVMCREWHLWWGAPYGSAPHMPRWQHWSGEKLFGQYDPATSIEQTRPGSSWRRYLNCVGYPLLGPYDSGQPDIIRWQLETAKNAGIECLHIHLWPSLWDDGADFTPIPIFETILDTAARMKYPVAVHDEIMFRRPPITKAQTLESSIRRTVMLLKRYGSHPGWYKIDGMPVYYFQNWTGWLKPEDMARYLERVEAEVGPVYWMVEQGNSDSVFSIPRIKAVLCHNNSWFLHTPPFGVGPHPWERLDESMRKGAALARKHGKKLGVLVYTRFNNNHDRSTPGRGRIGAEDGMFFVESLRRALALKPDFIVLTQWNDFEECAFIEPAWDYDGNNGDPYRYCRIVAASMNKKFTPAPLPERSQLDSYIRHRLFGDSQPGDMGPVFQQAVRRGNRLDVKWTDGPKPAAVRLIQRELAQWRPELIRYEARKLRLANYSVLDGTASSNGLEWRFYVPGMTAPRYGMIWMGLHVAGDDQARPAVAYRSADENYRIDSRWESRTAPLASGLVYRLPDQSTFYWVPLYDARFSGTEGDLTVRVRNPKSKFRVRELLLWSPELKEHQVPPAPVMDLPEGLDRARPLVAAAYDAAGNAGTPVLIYDGLKIAPKPPKAVKPVKAVKAAKPSAPVKTAPVAVPVKLTDGEFREPFADLSHWKVRAGRKPELAASYAGADHAPFVRLNNTLLEAELPVTWSRFDLQVKIFQTHFSRGQWVALFDDSCTRGIGLLWDSSLEKMFDGTGFAVMIAFDLQAPAGFNSPFKRLGRSMTTGFKVNRLPFADFRLKVEKDGMVLWAGNRELARTALPGSDFKFRRLLIRGNDSGFFDEIILRGQ